MPDPTPLPTMPYPLEGLPKCKNPGCTRVVRTLGLCNACYHKFRLERETRRCKCGGVWFASGLCRPCYFQKYRKEHAETYLRAQRLRCPSTKELDALAIFIEAFDIRGEDGISAEMFLAQYILWLRPIMQMHQPRRGSFRRRTLELNGYKEALRASS